MTLSKCSICNQQVKKLATHMRRAHPGKGPGRGRPRRNNKRVPTSVVGTASALAGPVFTGRRLPRARVGALSKVEGEVLGTTPAGRAWALRALHPNDDRTAGGASIPDSANAKTASIEARIDAVISPLVDVGGSTWDCQVVVLPVVDATLALRTRKSGGTWSFWQCIQPHLGTIRPGLAKPAINAASEITIVSQPAMSGSTNGFRQTFKGVTFELNASAINNQGIVTSGQYADAFDMDLIAFQRGNEAVAIGNRLQALIVKDIPESFTQVVDKVPTAGQWPAREGVYLPMRFLDDFHQYKSDASSELLTNGQQPAGVPIIIKHSDAENNISDLLWDSQLNSANAVTTTNVINQQIGVVIFSGIASDATIFVKLREGVQLQPTTDNPLIATIQDAPDRKSVV